MAEAIGLQGGMSNKLHVSYVCKFGETEEYWLRSHGNGRWRGPF